MKKRLLSVAAATALLGLAFSAPAWTGSKDYTGPSCNNFTGGDGVYKSYGGSEAFVSVQATTDSPTCAKTTYTLYVTQSSGPTLVQPIGGGTTMACPDNGTPSSSCISWTVDMGPVTSAPTSVCVHATSSSSNKVNDRAADTDGACVGLLLGTT